MLRSYISLEQLRYNNFNWEINIAENVLENKISIPGMIIQPFVENAIVHGFQPERKDWMLNISVELQDKQIICIVDDNGIGREKSFELNKERNEERQSHGTNIAISRLTLLNNKKRKLINKVTYLDKTENGIPNGTKVTIQIPIL
jgi:LytS/YehU family sensor histidine kinase